MTKNPIANAFSAAVYIGFVVGIINFISQTQGEKPDTIFAPMLLLFLLTLSVTVMATIFFYQPLQLFIGGKKKAALDLFVRTVAAFAVMTVGVLGLVFLPLS